MKDATNTLGPLIDKLISNPLSFKTTKESATETVERPAGYIVLSKRKLKKTSEQPNQQSSQNIAELEDKEEMRKPKSMYEAVQAYTGKKFLTKAEIKAEKKKAKEKKRIQEKPMVSDEDLGEDLGEELGEELDDNHKISQPVTDSASDYESASEFPEDKVESSVSEETSEESAKESSREPVGPVSTDSEDEEDEDFDISKHKDPNSSENSESDEALNSVDSEEDLSVNSETRLLKEDATSYLNSKSSSTPEASDESLSKKIVVTSNEDAPTPPTSPENESDDKQIDNDQLPLKEFYQLNEYSEDRGSNNSTRIFKNWRELTGKQPSGLLNHGVTCYMNSAIQAMLHIPALQHYLNDIHRGKYDSILKPKSTSHILSDLSRKMWGFDSDKTPKYVNPKKIIQRLEDINCMMSEWQQEDAHEYFMSLMSRLQEDSTPKGKKLNSSILYDIFGGLLHQSVTCKNCGHISNTKQEFYDLSLGLNKKKKITSTTSTQETQETEEISESAKESKQNQKYSIEKSISDFFSAELIKLDPKDKSSGYECESCKQRTNAIKVSTIDRAPETLTVHMKRFKFNGNSSSKMKQSVAYPKYLDLSNYASDQSSMRYQLISVIVHEGRSLSSGHYVAHCLQPDGTWANYDDEYINKVSEREALKDPGAYFLVYSRLTHKSKKRGNENTNEGPKKRRK